MSSAIVKQFHCHFPACTGYPREIFNFVTWEVMDPLLFSLFLNVPHSNCCCKGIMCSVCVKPRKQSDSGHGTFVQNKVFDIAKATKTFEC